MFGDGHVSIHNKTLNIMNMYNGIESILSKQMVWI
jgi:hypothetical protein